MNDREELQALRRMAELESKERASVSPTAGQSGLENVAAGIGMGAAKLGRAAGQAFGLYSQADLDEADRLDKSLEATTGGKVGSAVGQLATGTVAGIVAGAALPLTGLAGATTFGGGLGALTTEGGLKERAVGAVTGALGGAAGKAAGDFIGAGANALVSKLTQSGQRQAVANAGRDAAAVAAKDAGYVLPPNEVNPSLTNEVLTGLSGKIKTSQVAAEKNQGVTNALAKKSVGVPETDQLNIAALDAVRKQAGAAYDAIANTGTVTPGPAYNAALDKIASPYLKAAQGFPGSKPSPVLDEINALRSPQFDAASAVAKIRTLREAADTAYSGGDKATGKALKEGAKALEDALEEHATKLGSPDLLNQFKAARQLIAKTYSVQAGLNDTTGNVSANVLARQLQKGKPLTGELETIARASQAFPKATQTLTQAPGSVSPLDYGAISIAGGNPLSVLLMGSRPLARSLVLSRPYQSMVSPPSYGPNSLTRLALEGAQSPALTNALIPLAAGVSAKRDRGARAR